MRIISFSSTNLTSNRFSYDIDGIYCVVDADSGLGGRQSVATFNRFQFTRIIIILLPMKKKKTEYVPNGDTSRTGMYNKSEFTNRATVATHVPRALRTVADWQTNDY